MSVFSKVAATQVSAAAIADRVAALSAKVLGEFERTQASNTVSAFGGMIGDLENSDQILDEKLADAATALSRLEALFA